MSTDQSTTPADETPNAESATPAAEPHTADPAAADPNADAETPAPDAETPNAETTDDDGHEDDGTTFDREYVQRLRSESAGHRKRAREAEDAIDGLRRELWGYQVAATGLLADPEDLPFDPEAAGDPEAVKAAAEALIERKPHMRRTGTAGPLPEAANKAPGAGGVSWSSLLRPGA